MHKDNVELHSINIVINQVPHTNNSYICIGNKPEYNSSGVIRYEEIFYTFFGKKNQG